MSSGKWDMKSWKQTNQPIGLLQALGINKGKAAFPQLGTQLPQQAQQSASGSHGASGGNLGNPKGGTTAQNQALGQQMAAAQPYNWTGDQWTALNNIVMAESGWDTTIDNGGGHGYEGGNVAYGIPQALPGSKMASAGADWQTNPATQIKWMLGYIQSTYGTPQNAWAFHLAHGWY
jgi:hypothetical protein